MKKRLPNISARTSASLAGTVRCLLGPKWRLGSPYRVGGFADRCYVVAGDVLGPHRDVRHIRASLNRDDHSRAVAAAIQTHVWEHGFAHGRYRVPPPIGYDAGSGWWVYQQAPGQLATNVAPARRNDLAGDIGGWLAQLHAIRPEKGFVRPPSAIRLYWRNMVRSSRPLPRAQRDEFARWAREIMKLDLSLPKRPGTRIVHHDLHPRNILVRSNGITVMDFTESRVSSPIADVAFAMIQWVLQFHESHDRTTRHLATMIRSYKNVMTMSWPNAKERTALVRYAWRRIALQRVIGDLLERRSPDDRFADLRRIPPISL